MHLADTLFCFSQPHWVSAAGDTSGSTADSQSCNNDGEGHRRAAGKGYRTVVSCCTADLVMQPGELLTDW